MNSLILALALSFSGYSFAQEKSSYFDYFIAPSSEHVDWSSPSSTLRSFVTSLMKTGPLNLNKGRYRTGMGHAMVHYHCQLPSGEMVESWSAMSGESDQKFSYELVAKEKIGLNVLRYQFEDGYIQSEEEVKGRLATFKGRREEGLDGRKVRMQPLFLRYLISETECLAINDFYKAFNGKTKMQHPTREHVLSLPKEERLIYGLDLDPVELYKKNGPNGILGAGCTSYATSFLKIGKFYDESLDAFLKRDLVASSEFFGTKEKPVKLKKILLGGKSWAKQNTTEVERISFYDPEKIWTFMSDLKSCTKKSGEDNYCPLEVELWATSNNLELSPVKLAVAGSFNGKKSRNEIEGVLIKR
ncbi:MAG: hypothetical protein ACOYL6_18095 [Bacteriovoracaceae bacterium]